MGSDGGAAADSGKVARLIDRYGLDGTGDDLVARWTGDGAERSSLRELADWFNRELLRVSMVRAGMNPMDRTVEHHHDALTDTEGSEGHRTEVRNELARAGVDVDALLADFVSHQSVHTYLTRVRGARSPTENTAPVANDVQSIRRLLGRTTTVADDALERHRTADRIALGEFDVLVDLRVICRDCGTDSDVVSLLEEGGCDCESDD
jgi:hypothetical protein